MDSKLSEDYNGFAYHRLCSSVATFITSFLNSETSVTEIVIRLYYSTRGCDCGVCDEADQELDAEAKDLAFGPAENLAVETNFGRKKRDAEQRPQRPKQHCTSVEVT